MLGNLLPCEREALLKVGQKRPLDVSDRMYLVRLCLMELIKGDAKQRVVLTALGRKYYDVILAEDEKAGSLFPSNVQPQNN